VQNAFGELQSLAERKGLPIPDAWLIRAARQQLARQFAQRSERSTEVYVWCDLAPHDAGNGAPCPVKERQ
jgi:hypothetical protein